MNESE
jgi:uncharacterized protein YodC (DUF2158 family)